METRSVVLAVVLVFTAALAALTIDVMLREGPDVLTVLSLLVIALFGFGIVGALRNPPK
jgi:prepilin signal peptidase PulO-like enzyme (type II secretory pathway)